MNLDSVTIGKVFECAFGYLRQTEFRHEYAYKRHSHTKCSWERTPLNTASMMTEFRVGLRRPMSSFSTAPGPSTRSSPSETASANERIDEYRKVFASVNVIVGKNHWFLFLMQCSDVGVLRLSGRYQISEIEQHRTHQAVQMQQASLMLSVREKRASS